MSGFELQPYAPEGLGDLASASERAIGAVAMHIIDATSNAGPVSTVGEPTEIVIGEEDPQPYILEQVSRLYPLIPGYGRMLPGLPDARVNHVSVTHLRMRPQEAIPDPLMLQHPVGIVSMHATIPGGENDGHLQLAIGTEGQVLMPPYPGEDDPNFFVTPAERAVMRRGDVRLQFIDSYMGALAATDLVAAAAGKVGVTRSPRRPLVDQFRGWQEVGTVSANNGRIFVQSWANARVPDLRRRPASH